MAMYNAKWIVTFLFLLCVAQLVASCSRELMKLVSVCHSEITGAIPRLHTGPLIILESVELIEAHCRQNTSQYVLQCMSELMTCPARAHMRRACNMASLETDVLVRRMDLTCRHTHVLRKDVDCVNQQVCSMKLCLARAARPAHVMNFAILSPPQQDSKCSWLDRVKKCYDQHVRPKCSDAIVDYVSEMLDTYKPPSCVHDTDSSQEQDNGSHETFSPNIFTICAFYIAVIIVGVLTFETSKCEHQLRN